MGILRRQIITQPTIEPVHEHEAKDHLVIPYSDDDAQVTRMIKSSRQYVENRTGRALVRQKWRAYFDFHFIDEMELAPAPVQAIDSVNYVDTDGNNQAVTSTIYAFNQAENTVRLAYGQTWPTARWQYNAVWVDYWAGYYDATESPVDLTGHVPEDLKAAILLIVGDLYENRNRQVEMQLYTNQSVEMLLQPYWIPHL